ncbi:SAM-dependent methyltransferase [Streptomyces pinistramenti]|uniref:SAM-dependent methyltransferase n=1 Tax=Streptomyces pinistramenti TaxID=2884812 RepID=UPI001D096249|nr:class I SAM-dependent methyltransferase [Streptomyces pinistramenti]MCB5906192.1 class I SAM-dependent methyltransferase [Streptomyces pinistramenti]
MTRGGQGTVPHYAGDVVGAQLGLPGGGLHIYLTGDLLHPPMVSDPGIWSDGRQWRRGAALHTLQIAELAELAAGEWVMDIGGGLGGPARLLAGRRGVHVTSVTNSPVHAETCRRLNRAHRPSRGSVAVRVGDCQRSLPAGPFDAALSINMLYQVKDHRALYERVFRSLAPGGRFVVDDWMLTSLATDADIAALTRHFQFPYFARTTTVEDDLMSAGFPPAEASLDLGHVARGPMADHFERQMWDHFAPRVISDWPGDPVGAPGRPAYGRLMIEEFVTAVNLTIDLYLRRCMTYRRLLVRKPSS